MILGIDYGATTTDAVAFNGKNVVRTISLPSTNHYSIHALQKQLNISPTLIAVTGGKEKRYAKKYANALRINEIIAIGRGGSLLAQKKKCLVASLGTGTCIVYVNGAAVSHCCGTGVGGGTVQGLSKLLTGVENIHELQKQALRGSLKNMDLTVGDIIGGGIGIVPSTATASHFGKAQSGNPEDKILATLNLVAQSIAMLIIMAAQHMRIETIVLTGKVATMPLVQEQMRKTFAVYNKTFIIPEHAGVATAVGAAASVV